jgi:hypothetical protein
MDLRRAAPRLSTISEIVYLISNNTSMTVGRFSIPSFNLAGTVTSEPGVPLMFICSTYQASEHVGAYK